jgi:hypothetical protein
MAVLQFWGFPACKTGDFHFAILGIFSLQETGGGVYNSSGRSVQFGAVRMFNSRGQSVQFDAAYAAPPYFPAKAFFCLSKAIPRIKNKAAVYNSGDF